MDTITIRDLEVFVCVGVPDEERARPQRLLLNRTRTLTPSSRRKPKPASKLRPSRERMVARIRARRLSALRAA